MQRKTCQPTVKIIGVENPTLAVNTADTCLRQHQRRHVD
jgi:hypothetical protein